MIIVDSFIDELEKIAVSRFPTKKLLETNTDLLKENMKSLRNQRKYKTTMKKALLKKTASTRVRRES